MFRKPRWSVVWPIRPEGFIPVGVVAADPVDAVRVASAWDLPLAEGYSIAFDYEPMVWRLKRPYWLRAHQVAGPDYPAMVVPGADEFRPVPQVDI